MKSAQATVARILEFWIEPGSGNVHTRGIARLVDIGE